MSSNRTAPTPPWLRALTWLVCAGVVIAVVLSVTVSSEPVPANTTRAASAGHDPLVYQGGPVMTHASTYALFWQPSTLQDHTASPTPPQMDPLIIQFLKDLGGQGLFGVLSQYYDVSAGTRVHVSPSVAFAGSVQDTSPYPAAAGACHREVNCITQGAVQSELEAVMAAHHWSPGLDHLFLVYLSPNEDVCDTACAATSKKDSWCGTHYDGTDGAAHLVYGVFITDTSDQGCDNVDGNDHNPLPSPNHSALIDGLLSSTAHEMTEAITDPLSASTGWTTVSGSQAGSEVADICESSFLPIEPDGANQQWNGHRYQVQALWDNSSHRCVSSAH